MAFFRVYYTKIAKTNDLIEADSLEEAQAQIEKRNIGIATYEVTKVIEEPGWHIGGDDIAYRIGGGRWPSR